MAPPARSNWYLMSALLAMGAHSQVSMWCSRPSSPDVDDLAHAVGQRVVAVVERLEHHQPRVGRGLAGRLGHRGGLLGVGGEGLLAQDVLPGGQRGQGPLGVEAVGEGDVDGVDVRIVDDGLVAVGDPRDPVPVGEGGRTCPVTGRNHLDGHLGIGCSPAGSARRGRSVPPRGSRTSLSVDVMGDQCLCPGSGRPMDEDGLAPGLGRGARSAGQWGPGRR